MQQESWPAVILERVWSKLTKRGYFPRIHDVLGIKKSKVITLRRPDVVIRCQTLDWGHAFVGESSISIFFDKQIVVESNYCKLVSLCRNEIKLSYSQKKSYNNQMIEETTTETRNLWHPYYPPSS